MAAELEMRLWPLILHSPNRPFVLVPIQPQWAAELFEHRLARERLLESNTFLMMNPDNVYYKTARRCDGLRKGARILWYVAAGDVHPGAIRGTSICREVIEAPPGDLFRQFGHLGVFERRDLGKMTRGDWTKRLTAFRFSHSRLFDKPVDRRSLEKLLVHATGKQPVLQTALELPATVARLILKTAGE